MKILAISGSLRTASSNAALIEASALLAPPNCEVIISHALGGLPHFNPDLDNETPPDSVTSWRAQWRAADAALICSPEYARGIPGSLKNGLDWLVSSGELMNKPLALINISPRSTFAHSQLTEILTVMMAKIIPTASPTLAISGTNLDAAGIAAHPEFSVRLSEAVAAIIAERKKAGEE